MMIVCKEVIISELTSGGNGSHDNPHRSIKEVYEKDGTLIISDDRPSFWSAFRVIDGFCETLSPEGKEKWKEARKAILNSL